MARASLIADDLREIARALPALDRTERRAAVHRAMDAVEAGIAVWDGTVAAEIIRTHARELGRTDLVDTPDLQEHLYALSALLRLTDG